MILNTKTIIGHKLSAIDGDIGHVRDFYIDDKTWAVRYVVAETGTWLTGRKVLLSPYAFVRFFDTVGKVLPVNLTRQQIENSPSIELHRPVSRQFEENYYRYYGWPAYWQGEQMWGMTQYLETRWHDNAAALEMFGYEFDPDATPMRCQPGTTTPWLRRTQILGSEWNSVPQDLSTAPRILHFTGAYPFAERLERLRAAVSRQTTRVPLEAQARSRIP